MPRYSATGIASYQPAQGQRDGDVPDVLAGSVGMPRPEEHRDGGEGVGIAVISPTSIPGQLDAERSS